MLSGRRLDLIDPSPLDVEIGDIAHGLARVARWNGQTKGPEIFSVAQHSLLVEALFAACEIPPSGGARLAALLHDAPEYVIGDMISPFKAAVGGDYKLVEARLMRAVLIRFGLTAEPSEDLERRIKVADLGLARSLIPAGTATLRDFSYIAPDIPEYIPSNCTGCMDCVTLCPDTAILGKVLSEGEMEQKLAAIADPIDREMYRKQWSKTRKYYEGPAKKGDEGGMFQIIIDPSKCKGCAECVTVCDSSWCQ